MSARLRAGLLSVWIIITFAGCAVAPLRPSAEVLAAWQARQARLQDVRAWELHGRLAVRAGEQGGHMGLRWQRRPDQDVIDLSGPLGKPLLQLKRDASGAWLRDAEQKTFSAPDAESLVLSLTGWRLPLTGLPYWILGLPLPDAALREELDQEGRLKRLYQLGWDVQFLDYAMYDGRELPRRLLLRLTEPDAAAPAVELRLVVAQWALK